MHAVIIIWKFGRVGKSLEKPIYHPEVQAVLENKVIIIEKQPMSLHIYKCLHVNKK